MVQMKTGTNRTMHNSGSPNKMTLRQAPLPLFRWCTEVQLLQGQCKSFRVWNPDVFVLRSIKCCGTGVDEYLLKVSQPE
jgi:hypothetical protein